MSTYAKWMKPQLQRLIWFVTRVQGLIVAPGNPKAVTGVADLGRPGLRFVNRQRGSGTRTLLELLLARAGVDRARIAGYENEEFTHAAVASSPAGLPTPDWRRGGRRPVSARPSVTTERYFLICREDVLDYPAVREVLALIRSQPFRDVVAALPGYTAVRSGEISTIPEAVPWAHFQEDG
jgi:molybdate-binding protein